MSIPDTDPAHLLAETVERITPLDAAAVEAARARQGSLTKPPGSLGVLEEVSVRLAGITGTCPPAVPARPVVDEPPMALVATPAGVSK